VNPLLPPGRSGPLQKGYFDHLSPNESRDARIARYLESPLMPTADFSA
jgi:hypothetical protein